jgi:hypothetical protein
VLPFVWGGRGWKKEEEMKEEREREKKTVFATLETTYSTVSSARLVNFHFPVFSLPACFAPPPLSLYYALGVYSTYSVAFLFFLV